MSGSIWRQITAKSLQSLVTLIVVVVLVFLLVRMTPGDPVTMMLGAEGSAEAAAALTEQLHLDKSIPEQFALYLRDVGRGDLGESLVQGGTSVGEIIQQSLPVTLAVVFSGLLVSVVIGISLGLVAAMTKRPAIDISVRSFAMLLYATPTFLIALVLILIFSLHLNWVPAGGWPDSFTESFSYLVLPGLALSGFLTPIIIRTVRQAAINVSDQLFVEAALSRGISPRTLYLRHILPNSLLPVVTLIGINLGSLLTGAIIVEAVFNLPGLGAEMVTAVARRDYPVIQGIALVSAAGVIFGNLLAEISYVIIDPRTRKAG